MRNTKTIKGKITATQTQPCILITFPYHTLQILMTSWDFLSLILNFSLMHLIHLPQNNVTGLIKRNPLIGAHKHTHTHRWWSVKTKTSRYHVACWVMMSHHFLLMIFLLKSTHGQFYRPSPLKNMETSSDNSSTHRSGPTPTANIEGWRSRFQRPTINPAHSNACLPYMPPYICA